MLIVAWMGCSFLTGSEEVQVKAPVPVPKVEEAYVHASLLKLRNHPQPDAGSWSPLGINTRLRVVGREGDWVRVISADGRTGWVSAQYLGAERLTIDDVRGQIANATDDDERLVWWQRAAALAPSDKEVMTGLAGAYRAVGQVADAEKVEAVRDEEVNRFDAWFPSDRAEVDAITKELASVSSAEQLVALWGRARNVTSAMGEPLAAAWDGERFAGGDPRMMLSERMAWANLEMVAEGTVPVLELADEPWVLAARRTPEPEDDAFFQLVSTAYEELGGRGWATWNRRTWDYGGCSPFGDGNALHLKVLEQTDALTGWAPGAEAVARIRSDALADIVKADADEFPFCSETPTAGLVAEATAILEKVKLTDEERAKVQARLDSRFGRSS
jgi:hypothetical protein